MGATLMTQAVADAIEPGDHGSTFAANPVVCAAAQVVFETHLRPGLSGARALGRRYLREGLLELQDKYASIAEVRGARPDLGRRSASVPVGPAVDRCAGYRGC